MTKTLITLLLVSSSALAAECDPSVYSEARETLQYQLRIERMEANHHLLEMRSRGLEVSYAASGALTPSKQEVAAAFAADEASWEFSCRSPHVLELQRRLVRAAKESAAARLSDITGGAFLQKWRQAVNL
ncbi:TPA: hypothetical protein NIA45_006748 [Pseudomonas aeruginosa]|nr:hypothetical protein [Pseudomonas aeruginosa]